MNGRAHQSGQRRLRVMLYIGGSIATSAGVHTLVAGGKSFPPWRTAGAMVESELRFYSAFYVVYGLFMLRTARGVERDPRAPQELAATLFLAGLGRAGAWLTVGKPHPLQRALLAIELAAPPLLLLEHARHRSTTMEQASG